MLDLFTCQNDRLYLFFFFVQGFLYRRIYQTPSRGYRKTEQAQRSDCLAGNFSLTATTEASPGAPLFHSCLAGEHSIEVILSFPLFFLTPERYFVEHIIWNGLSKARYSSLHLWLKGPGFPSWVVFLKRKLRA